MSQINRYSEMDPGEISFPRSSVEAEISEIKVNAAGNIYVGREFSGDEVRILVMRK